MKMRRRDIVSGIFFILSTIDFALAAPVLVQEKRKAGVDVVHIPKDVITVLGKRAGNEDLAKMMEDYIKTFETTENPASSSGAHASSSSAPPGPDHGLTNVAQVPGSNPSSSTAHQNLLVEPSSQPSTASLGKGVWWEAPLPSEDPWYKPLGYKPIEGGSEIHSVPSSNEASTENEDSSDDGMTWANQAPQWKKPKLVKNPSLTSPPFDYHKWKAVMNIDSPPARVATHFESGPTTDYYEGHSPVGKSSYGINFDSPPPSAPATHVESVRPHAQDQSKYWKFFDSPPTKVAPASSDSEPSQPHVDHLKDAGITIPVSMLDILFPRLRESNLWKNLGTPPSRVAAPFEPGQPYVNQEESNYWKDFNTPPPRVAAPFEPGQVYEDHSSSDDESDYWKYLATPRTNPRLTTKLDSHPNLMVANQYPPSPLSSTGFDQVHDVVNPPSPHATSPTAVSPMAYPPPSSNLLVGSPSGAHEVVTPSSLGLGSPKDDAVTEPATNPESTIPELSSEQPSSNSASQAAIYAAKGKAVQLRSISGAGRNVGNAA